MSTIRYTRSVITPTFRANFPLVFLEKKIVMGKKRSLCAPCLDVIGDPFSREIYSEVLFLPKKRA